MVGGDTTPRKMGQTVLTRVCASLGRKKGSPSSKQFVHLSGVRAVLRLEGNAPVGWSIVRREKYATAVVFCVPYPALPCPPPRLLFCREWEKSLQIIQGDVLKVPLPFFDVLVANVPYNVSVRVPSCNIW